MNKCPLILRPKPLLLVMAFLLIPPSIVKAEKVDDLSKTLHEFFEAEWEWHLKESPSSASWAGDDRYADLWEDISIQAINSRHKHRQQALKILREFDYKKLSKADRINYRLFEQKYQTEVEAHEFRWFLVPLNQREGIQTANELGEGISFRKVKDYENWIKRLKAFDKLMDQTIALMQMGIDERVVHARKIMIRLPGQVRSQIMKNPEASPFFKPFLSMGNEISSDEKQRLQQEAKAAIKKAVVPSYEKMLEFLEKKYLPACFDNVGVSQIPNGQKFYAHRARKYTTTNLTPDEIHNIGLSEVKRIRSEMEKIVEQVKFKGSFQEFLTFMRNDPQFYYKDPQELLKACQAVCKQIDPQLIKLFKTLPRMPYGVEPIPMNIAPDTTTAYYRRPAPDGSRAGTYFVNLYKPESRPKYEIEVLSLHEAVPGHHMQIALAMELDELPAFRRFSGYTAYIEGWGLYSESLGDELGLYKDPYSKFGQLTYEMWRAIRLVVDTGMHSKGWTRDQAIQLFKENTAKSILDIENEVDRYIAWPGQALAYKIGELKITELRARAEKKLGEQFEIREFHDVVLQNGAVTLEVLEELVDDWINKKKTE